MKFFKRFLYKTEPIQMETSIIDNNRVKITTRRGNDVRESVARVFTEEQISRIDDAKRNLRNKKR